MPFANSLNIPVVNNTVVTGTSTGFSSLTYGTASAASTVVQRDANQNIFSNNTFTKNTNTVSATGTTTLTVASTPSQTLTGTQPQTYQLPDATTLTIGAEYKFNNNTSNSVLTIKDGSGSTIFTVPFGGRAVILLIVNVTTAGSWDAHFELPANASYGTAGLTVTGNINSSALTASLPVFTDASKNLTSTGVVGEVHGGTAQSTYTTGDTLYASAANTLSKLAIGSAGQVLTVAGGVPSWAASSGGAGVKGFAYVNSAATTSATSTCSRATTPTTGNTTPLINLNYTPTSATNTLRFDFTGIASTSGAGCGAFIFQGSTLIASFPYLAAADNTVISFSYYIVSGTTSLTNYEIRFSSTVASTVIFASVYSNINTVSFSVTEYT